MVIAYFVWYFLLRQHTEAKKKEQEEQQRGSAGSRTITDTTGFGKAYFHTQLPLSARGLESLELFEAQSEQKNKGLHTPQNSS